MNLSVAIIMVGISVVFVVLHLYIGEFISNSIDNVAYKISRFGRYDVTNNELREKFKEFINNK